MHFVDSCGVVSDQALSVMPFASTNIGLALNRARCSALERHVCCRQDDGGISRTLRL